MILIRHAQSEFNAKTTSHHNSYLTQKGVEQAKKTAIFLEKYLNEVNYNPFVITSPMKRTFETSFHIALHNGLDIYKDYLILEQRNDNNGFKAEELHEINSKLTVIGHEPDEVVIERLQTFWEKYKNQDCIVVSHGTPIDILIRFAKNEKLNKCPEWDGTIRNCCITDTNNLKYLHKNTDHLN